MTINGSLHSIPIVKRFFGTVPALNHVTCTYGMRNNHIGLFGIRDPTLPIHYMTFVGLRWRYVAVYRTSPLWSVFFGTVPALNHVTC